MKAVDVIVIFTFVAYMAAWWFMDRQATKRRSEWEARFVGWIHGRNKHPNEGNDS
jgi:uncharacterized protein involved in cysteine biosynthesis